MHSEDNFDFEELGSNDFEDAPSDSDDFEELDFARRGFGSGGDGDDDWYYEDDDNQSDDLDDYGFSEDEDFV
jgi:hypothetical protein